MAALGTIRSGVNIIPVMLHVVLTAPSWVDRHVRAPDLLRPREEVAEAAAHEAASGDPRGGRRRRRPPPDYFARRDAGAGARSMFARGIRSIRAVPRRSRRGPAPVRRSVGRLSEPAERYNLLGCGVHAVGRRAISLLKATFRAPWGVSLCAWRIGAIVEADLWGLCHLGRARPLPAGHTTKCATAEKASGTSWRPSLMCE